MADDVLTLRDMRFTGFSVPDQMSGGGRQDPVIHKLSAGTRIIGARSPDDHAIFGASSSMTTPRSVGPSRSRSMSCRLGGIPITLRDGHHFDFAEHLAAQKAAAWCL
jgi:hypothetical protein